MTARKISFLCLLCAALLLSACGSQPASAASAPVQGAPVESAPVANAVESIQLPTHDITEYCMELGYPVETVIDDANCEDYKTCTFPDGSSCKIDEILLGACGREQTYCMQQGFELAMKDGELSCVFDDGSYCPEMNYLFGECQPGDISD